MEVEKEDEPIPSLLSIQTSRGDDFPDQQDSNWQQSSGWNSHSQHHWRKSEYTMISQLIRKKNIQPL